MFDSKPYFKDLLKRIQFFVFLIIMLFLSNQLIAVVPTNNKIDIKCGTFADSSLKNRIKKQLFPSLAVNDDRNKYELPFFYDSKLGKFRIHYNTKGEDSVSVIDSDKNGIPDYIDSVGFYFDQAYSLEVNQLGFMSPVGDSGLGGSEAYDIYITNIRGPYGLTYIDDFPILQNNRYRKCYSSFIVVDKSYLEIDTIIFNRDTLINGKDTSVKDSTIKNHYYSTGMEGLKITAAHEFFHALQFRMGVIPNNDTSQHFFQPYFSGFLEMTATWMEYRSYPDVKDYINYLHVIFEQNDLHLFSGDRSDLYCWSIFFQYTHKLYGDSFFKRIFDLFADSITPYSAMDIAFREHGSTLANAWKEFLPWIYFTGSRAIPGVYFEDADSFPEFIISDLIKVKSDTIVYRRILPFEPKMVRFGFPKLGHNVLENITFMYTNTDLFATNVQALEKPSTFIYRWKSGQQDNMRFFQSIKYSETIDSVSNVSICDTFFLTNSENIKFAYPNPFNIKKDSKIYFPASDESMFDEKVNLTIYNSEMLEVYSGDRTVFADYTSEKPPFKVVSVEGLTGLSSGIYFFVVKNQNSFSIGKFAVVLK
ncbi:MAG: DUF6055 domain-containing protein [Candidatus Kapabacteria bacterium]|nr:DUF6055 domain-containing protein [Candidatus Kapabacteria bacterium]